MVIAPGYYDQVVETWGGDLASEPLEGRLFNGCVVRCDLGEHIQRQIYYYGAYEFVEAYLFDRLAQPGMVVVDAGANVGQYSLIAGRRVGPSGQVHAFEPIPKNLQRLEAHIEDNGLSGIVHANHLALWDEERTLTMHLRRVDQQIGNATNFTAGEAPDAVETIVCQARRLDDYAREVGLERFDLLKIDIEGAELPALRGAGDLLERHRPTILMEVNREVAETMNSTPRGALGLPSPVRLPGPPDRPDRRGQRAPKLVRRDRSGQRPAPRRRTARGRPPGVDPQGDHAAITPSGDGPDPGHWRVGEAKPPRLVPTWLGRLSSQRFRTTSCFDKIQTGGRFRPARCAGTGGG